MNITIRMAQAWDIFKFKLFGLGLGDKLGVQLD